MDRGVSFVLLSSCGGLVFGPVVAVAVGLGGVVDFRELAGRVSVVPDVLAAPRRLVVTETNWYESQTVSVRIHYADYDDNEDIPIWYLTRVQVNGTDPAVHRDILIEHPGLGWVK